MNVASSQRLVIQSPYEIIRDARADMLTSTRPHQTPCDIIREARADAMGVRPVPTARPFTPKERDRVLFGSSRRGARPPSAVNLSYLHKTEGGVVKLPTIVPNVSNKKTRLPRTAQALSLDNLIEEVELTKDCVLDSNVNELAGMRKSYSSPQERLNNISSPGPSSHVLQNKWIGVTRQKSDPSNTSCMPQKKKVHRLRSIRTDSDDTDDKTTLNFPISRKEESLTSRDQITEERIQQCEQVYHPPNEIIVPTGPHAGAVIPQVPTEVDVVPDQFDGPDSPRTAVQSLDSEPEEVNRPVEDVPLDEDMVAVLSNGKLIWEPVPPKIEKPPASAVSDNAPRHKERNFDAMRQHLVQMQSHMRDLNGRIERIGSRVSSGSGGERTFHMNDNKRYHMTTPKNGNKTYKKYSGLTDEMLEKETDNGPSRSYNNTAGWDFFWKNSYFRTREEPLRTELQALVPTVDLLNTLAEDQDDETERVEQLIDSLYLSLKAVDAFSPGWMPTQFTSKLLHTLYKFADSESPKLLLLISRILLAVRIESGLAAACKMIFKVSRTDSNDTLFIQVTDLLELFLEGIGRASPLDAAENCIYGYGALKFLTANSNSAVLAQAVHLGAVDLVALHLKIVNNAQEEGTKVNEQTQQAIFQLTAALRNMADGAGIGPLFLTTNCLPPLAKSLAIYRSDEEIVTNVVRSFSSLSADEHVARVMVELPTDMPILLIDLLNQYQTNSQLVVRLAYTLGNLLAASDNARVQVSRHAPSVTTLLTILQLYVGKQVSTEDREVLDDVIVKIVRVLANMAINGIVGGYLSGDARLATALRVLIKDEPLQCNAVLLAALGCLNNLSYYVQPHSPCWLDLTQDVAGMLAGAVEGQSPERAVEACRVLGNLTRHKPSRDLLYSHGGVDTLGMMIEWGTGSVVRSVCGVLVNMLLDERVRQHFLENQGVHRLLGALERFSGDWVLAGLVCRAIWNSCAPDISLAAHLIHQDIDRLLTTLANCLEEDNWTEGDVEWEEFAAVATDLLERFNSHLEVESSG